MTGSLDIEQPDALLAYLREQGHIAATEQPLIRILAGGVSNRTVLVERPTGEAWVVKQALAKLRVQVDWFSSPERILGALADRPDVAGRRPAESEPARELAS